MARRRNLSFPLAASAFDGPGDPPKKKKKKKVVYDSKGNVASDADVKKWKEEAKRKHKGTSYSYDEFRIDLIDAVSGDKGKTSQEIYAAEGNVKGYKDAYDRYLNRKTKARIQDSTSRANYLKNLKQIQKQQRYPK
jgi:hypothetical protein|tara:strand:+ start:572 stop:979 length:408 start_codon:yes stop_codon:yes gene_type:complete